MSLPAKRPERSPFYKGYQDALIFFCAWATQCDL
jgi:hypothetical protein